MYTKNESKTKLSNRHFLFSLSNLKFIFDHTFNNKNVLGQFEKQVDFDFFTTDKTHNNDQIDIKEYLLVLVYVLHSQPIS